MMDIRGTGAVVADYLGPQGSGGDLSRVSREYMQLG